MREIRDDFPADLAGCVVVPTMGALHHGHTVLIRRAVAVAKARGTGAVVTIFVNPTQFNDPKDLDVYPRTFEADARMCREFGVAAVYAPTVGAVYPPGVEVPVGPIPAIASEPGLEDWFRPGHLEGVAQVVRRLFVMTSPSAAVFGEKDWQQYRLVADMSANEGLGIEILGEPTAREPDGLASSSRNVHLKGEAREQSVAISRGLRAAGVERTADGAEGTLREVLREAGIEYEYATVRDSRTLLPPTAGTTACRALVAAPVGGTRLIDNAPWPWDGE
ncbi:MAG: pantothenate synthetase [Phycisphaeraceae bacterium]|nr:MAG: pantothenate synthetase [Phycisphaeraceae bacterium]